MICLLITSSRGTLDENYCSINPFLNNKINVLYLLHYHLNDISNQHILPSLSKNISEIHTIYMHRYLMNLFMYDGKISVDHINRNKTDNRLSNLRLATQSLQNHNQNKQCDSCGESTESRTFYHIPLFFSFECSPNINTASNKSPKT